MCYTDVDGIAASTDYFKGDQLAAKVFIDKYALRDTEGQLLERSPPDMFRRLSSELARIEAGKFKSPMTAEEIYGYLDGFRYIVLQGSPMFGIGNDAQLSSLSNCFVVDSPADSYSGILKTDQELVQICKRRGGVGVDLSTLRPNGAKVSNAAKSSSGVVAFAERYSNTIREVGQSGRRGALMLTISVHHPDVLEFIKAKRDLKKLTGANISVRLTDEFMAAVRDKTDYELRWPVEGEPKARMRMSAEEVWNEIISSAWASAEPGLLFWDTIIRESPADCYADVGYKTVCTNPCCFSELNPPRVVTNHGSKLLTEVTSSDKVWIDKLGIWAETSGYFSSGTAETYEVVLSNGSTLHVTGNHKLAVATRKREGSVITRDAYSLARVDTLSVGAEIYRARSAPTGITGGVGNHDEGLILGWLAGDGCLSFADAEAVFPRLVLEFWKDEFDTCGTIEKAIHRLGFSDLQRQKLNKAENKLRIASSLLSRYITEKFETNIWNVKSNTEPCELLSQGSLDFISGFLASYFTADGTVLNDPAGSRFGIQLASINRARLKQISDLLLLFGIQSGIGLLREAGLSEFRGRTYSTKDCYRLTITGLRNLRRFNSRIGFVSDKKSNRLRDILRSREEIRDYKQSSYVTITSITNLGVLPVGCISVPEHGVFTADGIISGNSELPLGAKDSCRLSLLNTLSYVTNPYTKEAKFDFTMFISHAFVLQRLQDDIVDLEIEKIEKIVSKVKNDPEATDLKRVELELWQGILETAKNGRRTGTGVTAVGDTIAALGMQYGSDKSIRFVESLYSALAVGCYDSSVAMAREVGPFPVFDCKKEESNPFLARLAVNSPRLGEEVWEYGRRNIACLTTAPAGSVSLLTRTTSGIEPCFELAYTRRKKISPCDTEARVDFVDAMGDRWQEFIVYHPQVERWMEVTGETDISKSPWAGSCAREIAWMARVRLQAAANKYVDHAISSTINIPETATKEDVAAIYLEAWKTGTIKGLTVYRDNCRAGVLITTKKPAIQKTTAPKRPKELPCEVHHPTFRGDEYYAVVGLLEGEPYEVFTGVNAADSGRVVSRVVKSGKLIKKARGRYVLVTDSGEVSLTNGHSDPSADAITRLISTSLRHGADISFVVHQLEKTKGDLTSFAKVLARTLKKYIADGSEVHGENCSECGGKLVRQEGCLLCPSCGYSKCG